LSLAVNWKLWPSSATCQYDRLDERFFSPTPNTPP
jgi:hypothetical protein